MVTWQYLFSSTHGHGFLLVPRLFPTRALWFSSTLELSWIEKRKEKEVCKNSKCLSLVFDHNLNFQFSSIIQFTYFSTQAGTFSSLTSSFQISFFSVAHSFFFSWRKTWIFSSFQISAKKIILSYITRRKRSFLNFTKFLY